MKVAYITPFEARYQVPGNWSGTGYYIAQSLAQQGISIEYIGPLIERKHLTLIRKFKSRYYKLFGKTYVKDVELLILKDYAKQVESKLSKLDVDIVFAATPYSIAYLDCKQPKVFWGDATFANLLDFYENHTNPCKESLQNGHLVEQKALSSSRLAIYSSEWAANTAIHYYGALSNQVKVIPFGANISHEKSFKDVQGIINSRSSQVCKLLFLGMDWERKGGDIALKMTKYLNKMGLKTELLIVGCTPNFSSDLPSYVKQIGYISKSKPEGQKRIEQLLSEAHFLVLPSKADCTPIVFSEANSFGVPCISMDVGGISSVITNDVNGKFFAPTSTIEEYSNYVYTLFNNYSKYTELAISSFNTYRHHLNWQTSGAKVRKLLESIV